MTATRLVQSALVGIVFGQAGAASGAQDGPGLVLSGALLGVALLLITKAVRELPGGKAEDEDAPPPRCMKLTESVTARKALLLGADCVAVAAKPLVFTLGAVGAIAGAVHGAAVSVAVFFAFVALAQALSTGVIVSAALAPGSSRQALERVSAWLDRNDGDVVIVLGLVFGGWLLAKGLSGLGAL